jgi:activator of HSP90 ATPase
MKDYKNYFRIKAEPQDIFACLTNPFTIELWSGYPAKLTLEENAEFELWDGDISGKIISFTPDKELIQQWYFDTQQEESIVKIKLHPDKDQVSVELRHSNIPDEVYDEFVSGWEEDFFGAIKSFLED